MADESVITYVDRLLGEGFAVDVTENNVILIDYPPNASDLLDARDPARGIELTMHKDAVIAYLRQLGRTV
ncbi:hypothetical protein SB748_29395 [Rhizobium sp. SIMBA_035]